MKNQNEKQVAHLQLSKSSTTEQLKQYFMGIVAMNESNEEFPINLDDIWPLGYTRKNDAVRTLRNEFIDGEDFIVKDSSQLSDFQRLRKNAQQNKQESDFCSSDLRSKKDFSELSDSQRLLKFEQQKVGGDFRSKRYFLSVSCAEYLIVRKCRPAFEVYRQVFHQVVSGGVSLFGLGKYYTLNEYCQMFGKSPNSFYGLMANYREEFAMIGRTYYISKALCKMLEMRNNVERMRTAIKEKSFKNELGFQFDE